MTQRNFIIDYKDKLELDDVVFFIPYRGSNKFRVEALWYQLKYLSSIIDSPRIHILEASETPTVGKLINIIEGATIAVSYDLDDGVFHKTKYLNTLLRNSKKYWGDSFKYVCVLDYDTLIFPDAFGSAYKVLQYMEVDGEGGIVVPHSVMVYLDNELSEVVKEKDISILLEFDAKVNTQHPGGIQFFSVNALDIVNGWNEDLYLGGEDFEISYRIRVMTDNVVRLSAVAYHLYHPVVDWKHSKEYKDGLNILREVTMITDIKEMSEYITTKMRGCNVSTRV